MSNFEVVKAYNADLSMCTTGGRSDFLSGDDVYKVANLVQSLIRHYIPKWPFLLQWFIIAIDRQEGRQIPRS